MGTGGATALLSPECEAALAFRCVRSDASATPNPWGQEASDTDIIFRKNTIFNPQSKIRNLFWFAGIYIQVFISAEDSRRHNFGQVFF